MAFHLVSVGETFPATCLLFCVQQSTSSDFSVLCSPHLPYEGFANQPGAAKSEKERAALRIWLDMSNADIEKEACGVFGWRGAVGLDVWSSVSDGGYAPVDGDGVSGSLSH